MTELNIKNIGPVTDFHYEFSGPGLHVLHGWQGSGKTTILRTAELITNGSVDVRPSKRDGQPRGEAFLAGKTLRIVQQIRNEGELTISGTGDLSIADLHSPKFEKAATRDRHRIVALTRLSGVKADASLFYHLLGTKEGFEAVVPSDSLNTDDLVEMAQRVKRAIDREALRIEGLETSAQADTRAQSTIAESVDTLLEHDDEKLQGLLESAIKFRAVEQSKLDALLEQREAASNSIAKANDARKRLSELGKGKTVTEASHDLDRSKLDLSDAEATVKRIELELDAAKANARAAGAKYDAARVAVEQAKREESLHAELHAAIDAAGIVAPTEDDITKQQNSVVFANKNVDSAHAAVLQGVRVREALEAKKRAEKHFDTAKRLAEKVRKLRNAATDTSNVLTDAISHLDECSLRIKMDDDGNPRLVVATDRSETEPFDELSDGERWIRVVEVAAANNRLIVLQQSAYGELSPSSRELLHRLAIKNNCYILTAVADDCELRGEIYSI